MNKEAKRNFSNELEGVKRFGMVLANHRGVNWLGDRTPSAAACHRFIQQAIEIIMQPQQKERSVCEAF
jgi:hypothetical protein